MSKHFLFIYDCIYPQSLGGVEHRNLCLARALVAAGHKVTLAGWMKPLPSPATTSGTATSDTTPTDLNENLLYLPLKFQTPLYHQNGKRKLSAALAFTAACLFLNLKPYDVIETANIPYLHIFPLALKAKIARKKLLITWHEYFGAHWLQYKSGPFAFAYRVIEYVTAQFGRHICAVSQHTAKRLTAARWRKFVAAPQTNQSASAALLPILPNGVDLPALNNTRAKINTSTPNGPDLFYGGRLIPDKQLDLLLAALAVLKSSPHNPITASLHIAGDGPDRQRLEDLTLKLNLQSQVTFLGRLPTITEMWEKLATAKIAIQPSAREGFGLFPLEAMALGKPVIYCHSALNAISDLVRHKQEGLCAEATPAALSAALAELLTQPDLQTTFGQNASTRALAYNWQHIAEELLALMHAD